MALTVLPPQAGGNRESPSSLGLGGPAAAAQPGRRPWEVRELGGEAGTHSGTSCVGGIHPAVGTSHGGVHPAMGGCVTHITLVCVGCPVQMV